MFPVFQYHSIYPNIPFMALNKTPTIPPQATIWTRIWKAPHLVSTYHGRLTLLHGPLDLRAEVRHLRRPTTRVVAPSLGPREAGLAVRRLYTVSIAAMQDVGMIPGTTGILLPPMFLSRPIGRPKVARSSRPMCQRLVLEAFRSISFRPSASFPILGTRRT